MGIMQNKVSRRIALGSIAGGLASTVAVLSVLKGRYKVNMPDGASANAVTVGGKTVVDYHGVKITVDVPRMALKSQDDVKKAGEIVAAAVKKDPKYAEVNKMEFEKWKETNRQTRMAELAKMEKEDFQKIDGSNMGADEKLAATKAVRADYERARAMSEKIIAETEMPAL